MQAARAHLAPASAFPAIGADHLHRCLAPSLLHHLTLLHILVALTSWPFMRTASLYLYLA